MRRRRDYKILVIVALMIAIVSMGAGYAALNQKLEVDGVTNIGDPNWNVKIVAIEETDKSITDVASSAETSIGEEKGTTITAVQSGSTSANFEVTLNAPLDYAEFTVTVKNLGTIPAILDKLTLNQSETLEQVKYTVTPSDTSTREVLNPDGEETFVIRVEWLPSDEAPTETEKTAELVLDYVQSGA